MPIFSDSSAAWNTDSFPQTLKQEIEDLPTGSLPLHQGTNQGGMVDDTDLTATVIRAAGSKDIIEARVGIFFNEIVGGCSCGDDPMAESAYCELQVSIELATGEARFALVQE